MNRWRRLRYAGITLVAALVLAGASGCGWRDTEGKDPGSYTVAVELADVTNLQENSPVHVGEVTVGNVTRIERVERQRLPSHWLVTLRLNGDVVLPANTTAKLGQTNPAGSVHIELVPGVPPQGQLQNGSLIPLHRSG